MEETIIAVAIGAMVNLAGAWFIGREAARRELAKEAKVRFYERKWELYLDFARTIGGILESAKSGESDMSDWTSKIFAFTSGMWLIGSKEVIERFNDWRSVTAGPTGKPDPVEMLTSTMDILIAMRHDLGETNDPTHRDMLAMVINDIDEVLAKAR